MKLDWAAAAEADRGQAEYFRNVLAARRAELDHAIAEYAVMRPGQSHAAVASSRELGRAVRQAERERQEVNWMIAALDRRFSPAGPTAPPPVQPPSVEVVHPDGRSLLSTGRRSASKNLDRREGTRAPWRSA